MSQFLLEQKIQCKDGVTIEIMIENDGTVIVKNARNVNVYRESSSMNPDIGKLAPNSRIAAIVRSGPENFEVTMLRDGAPWTPRMEQPTITAVFYPSSLEKIILSCWGRERFEIPIAQQEEPTAAGTTV